MVTVFYVLAETHFVKIPHPRRVFKADVFKVKENDAET
jgi:hypothetical protein